MILKKLKIIVLVKVMVLSQTVSFAAERNYWNYELKDGHRVVYRGQTNNPDRREREHWRDGKEFGSLKIIGKAKTKEGALKEEKRSLERYRKNHKGQNPKYNRTNHG